LHARRCEDLAGLPDGCKLARAAQAPVKILHYSAALPYSSCITGFSKCVMLTHCNLVVNIDQTLPFPVMKSVDWTAAFLLFLQSHG
jgi:hypothetical protein